MSESKKCLVCDSNVEPFVSFGKMPIANGFLREDEFSKESFYDLAVGVCVGCKMVQLTELIDPSKLFHENYAYFSSTSQGMRKHFQAFALEALNQTTERSDRFVLEIGSNDGIMLRNIAEAGVRHLGVEPSENVAKAAIASGIQTRCCFFDSKSASQIRAEHGPADLILGANVICHIPDLHSLIQGVCTLLNKNGLFIFEEPYLGDIVNRTSYDQFYDEHFYYFSIQSLSELLNSYGLHIVNAQAQEVHGGSMRYTVCWAGDKTEAPALHSLKSREDQLGLDSLVKLNELKDRIEKSRDDLRSLLETLKGEGKRVVGYGATSKSTIVTNYGNIGPELVEYISDTTPTKQGKFNPGTHIPIMPYESFTANYPDYALLFAWNHREEIVEKEQHFLSQGGRFITFVPTVGIVD